MSTVAINASLAAVSAANNAAAQAAANAAKRERCLVEMDAYHPTAATVEQKHSYADCINFMYPSPSSDSEIIALKGFVLILIGLAIGGAIYGKSRAYGDWLDALCMALLFPMVGGIIIALGALAGSILAA